MLMRWRTPCSFAYWLAPANRCNATISSTQICKSHGNDMQMTFDSATLFSLSSQWRLIVVLISPNVIHLFHISLFFVINFNFNSFNFLFNFFFHTPVFIIYGRFHFHSYVSYLVIFIRRFYFGRWPLLPPLPTPFATSALEVNAINLISIYNKKKKKKKVFGWWCGGPRLVCK